MGCLTNPLGARRSPGGLDAARKGFRDANRGARCPLARLPPTPYTHKSPRMKEPPKAIIYSRNLYRGLRDILNAKNSTKIAGVSLKAIEDPIEFELIRRPPGQAESADGIERLRTLPERRKESHLLNKIRVGTDVHVADFDTAYGHDLRKYETVIFDLDCDPAGDALALIFELVMGFSADGNYQAPALWSKIADTDERTFIFVQAKTHENSARKSGIASLYEYPKSNVRDNYDVLPLTLTPFDSSHNIGRKLAKRYSVLVALSKRDKKTLDRWMEKSTAYRYVTKTARLPTGMEYKPLVGLLGDDMVFTVAGTCQVGKSIVGFIPASGLDPMDWVKTIVDISRTAFQENVFGTAVDNSDLAGMRLIARKTNFLEGEKPDQAIIKLVVDEKKIDMAVQSRTGSGSRPFRLDHLELLGHINKNTDDFEKADKATVKKENELAFDLREATRVVLKKVSRSEALADRIFPSKQRGKARRIGIPVEITR